MKNIIQRISELLSPGVRLLLVLLTAVYLLQWAGQISGSFHLSSWLALSPSAFFQGRIWQLVTHAVLSLNLADLAMNAFMIAWLGSWVERAWSRGEFLSYCAIAAAGAGSLKLLLSGFSCGPLAGTNSLTLGLMVAALRLYGHEQACLIGLGSIPMKLMLGLMLALNGLMLWANLGWLECVIQSGGALAGWGYLSVRWWFNRRQAARHATSERMGKLEF